MITFKIHIKTNRLYRIDSPKASFRWDRYYKGNNGFKGDKRISYTIDENGIVKIEESNT